MSAEAENQPVDQNAQAAADTQKLLAELQGQAKSEEQPAEPSSTTQDAEIGTKQEGDVTASVDAGTKPAEATNGHRERGGHRGGQRGRGGGRGRGGYQNHKSARDDKENIKSDLTTQEVTDDPIAIRKQVEFYFSDSNLPMDKFLLGKVGGSQNNSVELSIIHSFKRMRHFQPFEAIVEALKESTFLELTDENTAVRRKQPLPELASEGVDPEAVKIFEDKAMPRSVYVKGFGEEQPSTQFDIEAFFTPYGPTNAIRLRRTDDKIFKRSVFVEFESDELAQKFLELDPKPKFKGNDLLIMSKKEYCDKKVEDIKSGKIRPNQRSNRGGRDFSKRKRDDEDNRDWRERRGDDRKKGFRGDRGKHNHRGRDSRGRGGRDARGERDERGVPVVKSSGKDEEKSKQDTQKAEALAKARAAVQQENDKEDANIKKRPREEDSTAQGEREAKKQDVKAEV